MDVCCHLHPVGSSNDCGALKAAQVGVSLSEVEASIAAPFTCKEANITCIPRLIREGRAALVTSFQCFKYMALYSMIQFASVLLLYRINSNLGDWQYLWIDLCLILPLSFTMGYTGPSEELVIQRPPGSLFSFNVFASFFGQTFFVFAGQIMALFFISWQPWYVPLVPDPDSFNIQCFENTAVYLTSSFQYIFVVVSLSISKPFRKPLYTNVLFLLSLVVLVAVSGWSLVWPLPFMRDLLQLMDLPIDFRLYLLAGIAVNFSISYIYERVVVVWNIKKRFSTFFKARRDRRLMTRSATDKAESGGLPADRAPGCCGGCCCGGRQKAPVFKKRYHATLHQLRLEHRDRLARSALYGDGLDGDDLAGPSELFPGQSSHPGYQSGAGQAGLPMPPATATDPTLGGGGSVPVTQLPAQAAALD
ncbi:putative Cation-transporting ATPase 13A2 [Paratrimastix pyriformis]|uniref:Cation-transporting ATPase 13A2 n=1 Tax=Paratrimastix pyriformis TaxID=342808 RepID=A0ABQ8USG8_9EUKA|nr:putative Cation-transporting ATPase 13A2 [Paratrimastix pyriformis]